jgi:hypothetical protein
MTFRRDWLIVTAIGALALAALPAPMAQAAPYRSCAEAEAAGASPLYAGQPGYSSKLDRDSDGVACESGTSSGGAVLPAPTVDSPPTSTPLPSPAPINNDLAVSTAPTDQPCIPPLGIVVFGSAVTPGSYAADVQRLLDAHPGSLWLRTDQSCPSLRRATDAGNPIYMAYRIAGPAEADVCAAVKSEGGGADGKWLDTVHDPGYAIPCV